MGFEDVIERVKSISNLKYDKEVAYLLGMKTKAFSVRKIRDSIPTDKLRLWSESKGISFEWLLTGEGETYLPEKKAIEENALVYIPCYDVRVSAGGGAFVDAEQTHELIGFKREILQDKFSIAGKDLYCVTVAGDSMEPTLFDGDMVLVNGSDTTPTRDGIFVFRTDNGLFIKRIQIHIDGSIRIVSDNKMYDSYELKPEQQDNVRVFGRVMWYFKKAR